MRGGHVKEEAWVDLMAGAGDPRDRQHVRECATCRQTLDEVRAGWDLAREADVPEPSPLYWESFRRGVGRRIEEQAPLERGGRLSFRWAVAMAAVLVLAVAIFALGHRTAQSHPQETAAVLPAWSPLPSADSDAGLTVLAALDSSDLAHASCTDVASCLADVSDEEGDQIAAALRQELKGRPL
jgi:hypothetical protein